MTKVFLEALDSKKSLTINKEINYDTFSEFILPFSRELKNMEIYSIDIDFLPHKIYLRSNTTDIFVFEEVFINNEYKQDFKGKIESIFDCGAYIGLTSIYFSMLYPTSKIIAIEPNKENFELLKLNTKNYSNIEIINSAIWNSKVLYELDDSMATGEWGYMVKKKTSESKKGLETITMDEIIEKYHIKTIDILKLDIEGSEKDLFEKNYKSWLYLVRNLIIELHEKMRKGSTENFESAVSKFSFTKKKLKGKYGKYMRFLVKK